MHSSIDMRGCACTDPDSDMSKILQLLAYGHTNTAMPITNFPLCMYWLHVLLPVLVCLLLCILAGAETKSHHSTTMSATMTFE